MAKLRFERGGIAAVSDLKKGPEPATRPAPPTTELHEARHVDPPSHEQIAMLAYSLWEESGCTNGSADSDWFRAEEKLRGGAESRRANHA